ncbi:MAG TPA: tagaturonate epimerase family protein, partial [Sedimentisphaerales bacterium]|nr:tagaturonate epimerase family protein [Sedimentisphaerales bacterium]
PQDTRREADEAVLACVWKDPYFVDADHIGLNNVDAFIESSDFFTLDVADFIGQSADESDVRAFIKKHKKYISSLAVPGIDGALEITEQQVHTIARKFLLAIREAGKVYRHIEAAKGAGNFITEVSIDETDEPQTPVEMLFIIGAIADEGIPAQTIAPKFSGRFNKGVDYVGDVGKFAKEFEQDIAIVAFASREFGLPDNLKLSVHSGSDKFSIYGPIAETLKKFDAGLHLKTAGTTWLEELIGLAMAGGDGLAIAREVYAKSVSRIDELCAPYAAVIDIDRAKLPAPEAVNRWDEEAFASALRHNLSCERYDRNLRQLLHVAYKIPAEMGQRYFNALDKFQDIIAQNVTENIYDRHIKPLFMGI